MKMLRTILLFILLVLFVSLCFFVDASFTGGGGGSSGGNNNNNNQQGITVVIMCHSQSHRCLPPNLLTKTDIGEEMSRNPQQVFLVFTDVRSAEAARETVSTQLPKATIVPCDITEFGSSSSLLSCIATAIVTPIRLQQQKSSSSSGQQQQLIVFISGRATSVPNNILANMKSELLTNRLSGVTCLTVMPGLDSGGGGKKKSPETTKKKKKNNNKNDSEQEDEDAASNYVVYSAGFGRAPKYRSSLGGMLSSVFPNQVGLPADDARLRDVQQVDAIDFTASLVTFEAFLQSSVHPPMNYQRSIEWCPSSLAEVQWIVMKLSLSSLEQSLFPPSSPNNNNNNGGMSKKQKQDLVRSTQKEVKRALKFLESLDSDICTVRTRYGLRFDEMFHEPVSPVLLNGESGIVMPQESFASAANSLLFRLSSILNDAIATSHIIRGMESVSELGNSLAVLPNLQVRIDTVLPGITTISYPSIESSSSSVGSSLLSGRIIADFSTNKDKKFPLVVVWDQYCCHCCGFSSEIERFVLPLTVTVYLTSHISCFCTGQAEYERLKLEDMYLTPERLQSHPATDVIIWISHTQPYLFSHPLQEVHPIDYHIARMMFEWSRIDPAWVNEIKTGVNEVWVPGHWVQQVFVQSGVPASKIFVIPEAVDTHRFNPDVVKPFDDIDEAAKRLGWNLQCSRPSSSSNKKFVFFSNFKWEDRKGWQTLLTAYENFGKQHPDLAKDTTLYILTFAFNSKNPRDHMEIKSEIDAWYKQRIKEKLTSRKVQKEQEAWKEQQDEEADDDDEEEEDDNEQKSGSQGSGGSTNQAADNGEVGANNNNNGGYLDNNNNRHHNKDNNVHDYHHKKNKKKKKKKHLHNNNNKKKKHYGYSDNNNGGGNNDKDDDFDEENPFSEENTNWMKHLPRLCLIVDVIPDDEMDRLYASADAFVMPTRGEGWGLPIIQSMSLGKPVIATRWGGQLEFMNDQASFFIEIDGLEQQEGSSLAQGSKWAIPSATHLSQIMTYVVNNPEEAKKVGKKARAHIVQYFSDEAVRRIVEKRLHVIHDFVSSLYR